MRLLAVPLMLFAAGSTKVCDSDDKAPASASGSADVAVVASAAAETKAKLAAPRLGGAVAAAGELSVEVVVHASGLVEALVSDARGKALSDGVKLTATVQAQGGARQKVELGFVAPRARFEGRAAAGARLETGPVDLSLEVAGKQLGGKLEGVVALPEPRLGGHLLAAGAFSAEMMAKADGQVLAFLRSSADAAVGANAGLKLTAVLTASGGAREDIALAFDATCACFAGKAKAGVQLSPGPLELLIDAKVGGGIGRLESIGLNVEASHGGQMVAVGDFSVELVAQGQRLSAFVLDASGKAHAASDLDLKVTLGAGAGSTLALKWDAPSASYVGNAAANIDLSLMPVRIALVAAGKAFVGGLASLKATGNAKASLDGKLDAKGKLLQDAKAGASVKVTAPKVNASKSASAGAEVGAGKASGGAKASAGFSLGTK